MILVTGGTGYIGSHTVVELQKIGEEVVIVDNLMNSKIEVVDYIESITGKRPIFVKADVCDEAAMKELFSTYKIDAVIHFAGLKAVGESVEKPLWYYSNNLVSTMVLLKVMKEFGCKKIVFSSSATVYGSNNPIPFSEEMPTSATNPYGMTKVMQERMLEDIAFADKELSVALLRYFNPIGAHESGLIGEDPVGIPNNLMPYVTQVASGKREKLSVFGNDYDTPDGTGVRDYIHVVDLAKGHVAACEYLNKNSGCDVFNLGTGIGYSVLDLVHTFGKVNDLEIPYVIVDRRPGDVAQCYADAGKAKEKLGWTAEKTLEDMCRDSWRWQSKNPNGYRDE